jgi:23S rRNA (uracil1939-C5)-methyltransferase
MTVSRLRIDSIGAGGDGIGRSGELVVFVPRTAPGDVVEAQITRGKRFARGSLLRVEAPSPFRVEPTCEHYVEDRCGGCQIQHIAYGAQLEAKAGIIRDGLVRIGKRQVELPEVAPSPDSWRYRSKLTLAMRRSTGGWTIGLHRYDDPAAVFQLRDCPITDERVVEVWRSIFRASDLLPKSTERGSVRLTGEGGDGPALVFYGSGEWKNPERFFDAVSGAGSLWWTTERHGRNLLAARTGEHGARAAASFSQINPAMAAELRAHVVALARAHSPSTLIDAYSGSGSTAIPLSNSGIAVTAIELDREASDLSATRLSPPSRAIAGRVEDLLPTVLPSEVVLVNPPRSGLAAEVTELLATFPEQPRAIIYTSCDPATLGRDLARMPRWSIRSLRGFDMFPQTSHVETVCELIPDSR